MASPARFRPLYKVAPQILARVVEQVDTRDLKSLGSKELCRFNSGLGHK